MASKKCPKCGGALATIKIAGYRFQSCISCAAKNEKDLVKS